MHRFVFIVSFFCASVACLPKTSHAANLTTAVSQGGGHGWTEPIWQTNGTGAFVSAMRGNTYECVNDGITIVGNSTRITRLRTPLDRSAVETFPGDSLKLDPYTEIRFKNSNPEKDSLPPTPVYDFPGVNGDAGLILEGGMLNTGDNPVAPATNMVIAGKIRVDALSYIVPANNDFSGTNSENDNSHFRAFDFKAQLTGTGTLVFCGNGPAPQPPQLLSCASNTFSGQWIIKASWLRADGKNSLGTNSITVDPQYPLTNSAVNPNALNPGNPQESGYVDMAGPAILEPGYDVQSAGVLTLMNDGRIKLHQNCVFAAAAIEGVSLSPGKHAYSELAREFPENFPAGGSGSITIRPPIPVANHPGAINEITNNHTAEVK